MLTEGADHFQLGFQREWVIKSLWLSSERRDPPILTTSKVCSWFRIQTLETGCYQRCWVWTFHMEGKLECKQRFEWAWKLYPNKYKTEMSSTEFKLQVLFTIFHMTRICEYKMKQQDRRFKISKRKYCPHCLQLNWEKYCHKTSYRQKAWRGWKQLDLLTEQKYTKEH